MRNPKRRCCWPLSISARPQRATSTNPLTRSTTEACACRLAQIQGEINPASIDVQDDQTFALNKTGDLRYLVLSSADNVDAGCCPPSTLSLATVVTLLDPSHEPVTQAWLAPIIKRYGESDDVWQPEFLQGLIIATPEPEKASLSHDIKTWLQGLGTQWVRFSHADAGEASTLPGPYLCIDGALRSVARLYKDTYKTFMLAVNPAHQKVFKELKTARPADSVIEVAVPSRLKLQATRKGPLSGIRVAVKDSFHLFGTCTSISNRSYSDTYGVRRTTAACVETLIARGCTVVGKVKMSAFGVWEEPVDYMDYEAPWNPRADGHQSPGGSSSGSSVASAAYEWLDIAMGADTAGSIMRPALRGGVFGLRPSFDAVSKDGIVPGIPTMDTPCFVGRDLRLCKEFASAWYGEKCQPRKQIQSFKRIIWAKDYWDIIDNAQVRMAKNFTAELGCLLSSAVEVVSFEDDWRVDPPLEAKGSGLQAWMTSAIANIWFDDYHNFGQFREDHRKKFGTEPNVDRFVSDHWRQASQVSQAQCTEGYQRLSVFKKWFNSKYINDQADAVFVLPIEDLAPRYRDQSTAQITKPPRNLNSLYLAPVLGTPELIVPIDLVRYHSRVTDRDEFLPFALGLMADVGTDLALFDIAIECLERASRPTVVKTGRVPFDLGEHCSERTLQSSL